MGRIQGAFSDSRLAPVTGSTGPDPFAGRLSLFPWRCIAMTVVLVSFILPFSIPANARVTAVDFHTRANELQGVVDKGTRGRRKRGSGKAIYI